MKNPLTLIQTLIAQPHHMLVTVFVSNTLSEFHYNFSLINQNMFDEKRMCAQQKHFCYFGQNLTKIERKKVSMTITPFRTMLDQTSRLASNVLRSSRIKTLTGFRNPVKLLLGQANKQLFCCVPSQLSSLNRYRTIFLKRLPQGLVFKAYLKVKNPKVECFWL